MIPMNESNYDPNASTTGNKAIIFKTDIIRDFRNEVIDGLIVAFAVLGLFSTTAGVIKAYRCDAWNIIGLYVSIYCITVGMAFLRKKLSFRVKTSFGYLISYLLTVTVLVRFGLGGAGIWFLLAFCVVVTGLHGFKYGLITVGIGAVTITTVGLGSVYGLWPTGEKVWFDSASGYSWLLGGALFTVLASAMVICPGMLLKQLISFLAQLQEKSSELKDSNRSLKKEIGERKVAQEELTQIKTHLQELVEQRTCELSESNLKLVHEISERKTAERQREAMEVHLRQQQKLESLGTLASGVAHEINNPINVIMNYATLLSDRSENSPDLIREYAEEIFKEGERVAGIVRNLLTFARLGADSHNLCSLHELVEDTTALLHSPLTKAQITLHTEIDPESFWLSCNRQQIQQVFVNLIHNACDALSTTTPASDRPRRLIIRSHPVKDGERKMVRVEIVDNGPGIDEKTLERVFDPFFTTKSGGKGTGLGLSISHGIVKEHGGTLTVKSSPGEGATFILELPLSEK